MAIPSTDRPVSRSVDGLGVYIFNLSLDVKCQILTDIIQTNNRKPIRVFL